LHLLCRLLDMPGKAALLGWVTWFNAVFRSK